MPPSPEQSDNSHLLRPAIGCTTVGLLCVAFYLWQGFSVWSFGVGILFGIPTLVVGMGLYLLAVIHDLRRHGIL
jgi:hypothetical protein